MDENFLKQLFAELIESNEAALAAVCVALARSIGDEPFKTHLRAVAAASTARGEPSMTGKSLARAIAALELDRAQRS